MEIMEKQDKIENKINKELLKKDAHGTKKYRSSANFIARTAIIAALYAALTFVAAPISYGPIQFRISEALTILPLFYLEAIPGLAIGCLLANMLSTPWDIFLGTLATLVAAILTRLSRKIYIGWIWPVLVNAFTVPAILLISGVSETYWFNVLTVGGGELAVVVALGIPLYFGLRTAIKRNAFMQ